MKTLKSMIKTEVIYDEKNENKYVVKKEWDKSKKTALVIMKKTAITSQIVLDQSTMYVINNLAELAYGKVVIMNLFTALNGKDTKEASIENLKCLQNEIQQIDDVIIAVGTSVQNSKHAAERLEMMVALLLDKKMNILQIESPSGIKGYHPLCPAIKNGWKLVPYTME